MGTLRFTFTLLILAVANILLAQSKTKEKTPTLKDFPDGLYAVITTAKGDIVLSLAYDKVPVTVANFVGLAEGALQNNAKPMGTPFYDGLKFHRVVPNFMIQGGDPLGNGTGDPGYEFEDEYHPELTHSGPGVLSMANAGPGTNGSQFFITHTATPHLNNRHSVFGQVVSGQAVVDAIVEGDVISKVVIVRKGSAAKAFNAPKVFNTYMEEKKRKDAEKLAKVTAELEAYKKTAQTTPTGLMYILGNQPLGDKPMPGDTVLVHYDGYLLDGSKFDSSRDRGQPLPFILGVGQVIPGWDQGIALLTKGGKATLIIPPALAYGERGFPPVIPANSHLVFEVELVDVKKKK